MSEPFRKAFWMSVLVHSALVVGLLVVPFVLTLCNRKKPPEMITFVDLQAPPPSVPDPVIREDVPEPEPVVEPEPEPAPIPEPPPKPKPKPKRKEIQKSTRRIRRDSEPEKPRLTPEQIRKQLAGAVPTSGEVVQAELPAWYYSLVKKTFYDAWKQPASLSAVEGWRTSVELTVQKDGRITSKRVLASSGNDIMDASVNAALGAVSRLDPLPAAYAKNEARITVLFELTGGF